MFGALPKSWGPYKNFVKDLQMVLDQNGVKKTDPIGIDILDSQLILALQEAGFCLADGQDVMLEARMIKTEDELQIMRHAAATVDAPFDRVACLIRSGIRENDIQAEASHILRTLGAQWVINVQTTSGPRTCPHPHLSSDRILQPGDIIP